MLNFENLDKFYFPGIGPYDIPPIEPVTVYPEGEFIPINYHYSEKRPSEKNIHFFADDYQFIRYWNTPGKYIPKLSQFRAVCSPDFSTYIDMPVAMQIYNHYRKHWLAAYWQMHGMTVYPTISWSTTDSYAWCFDGEPVGGIVAVSSVGVCKDKDAMRLFLQGYEEMMKRLTPSWVIFYGKVPEECDWNVIRVKPFGAEFTERGKEARRREQAKTQISLFNLSEA